jgi:Flp pilus assembly pilin Flp
VRTLREFLCADAGQDLVEYSLLLAFMVIVSAALVFYNGDAVAGIWGVNTNNLKSGNELASH